MLKTGFIIILGECNESRDCKVKYSISILDRDEDESKGFVTLDVIRSNNEHTHLNKKTQIRGKYFIFLDT